MPLLLDVIRRPERDCLDREGRIEAGVGHQNTSISDEQIVDVVTLAIPAYHSGFRIVAHAASPVLMISHATFTVSTTPGFNGTGFIQQNFAFVHHVVCDFIIHFHPGVGDPGDGHSPRIPNIGIEVDAVRFLRQSLAVAAEMEISTEIFALEILVSLAPLRLARRAGSSKFDGKGAIVPATRYFPAARMIPIVEGDGRPRSFVMWNLAIEDSKCIRSSMVVQVSSHLAG